MDRTITFMDLLANGRLKKFDWVSFPIIEHKRSEILSSRSGELKNQVFSTEKIENMNLQFIEEAYGALKFIGEALDGFTVNFKGVNGNRCGPYEVNRVCFELFSMLDYGLVSCNITKNEYQKLPRNLQMQGVPYCIIEETNPFDLWLQIVDSNGSNGSYLYFSYGYSFGREQVIRPMYLLPANSKDIKIMSDERCNGMSKETGYKVIFDVK